MAGIEDGDTTTWNFNVSHALPDRPHWALLVHPQTSQEGVYTLTVDGTELLLLFSAYDQAWRFAARLQTTGFGLLHPRPWDKVVVGDFCDRHGFSPCVVPAEKELQPPARNTHESAVDAIEAKRTRLEELWRQQPP